LELFRRGVRSVEEQDAAGVFGRLLRERRGGGGEEE
jgi:hypothetical protein